ncbi:X-linked retinitis pigmentosa GTPase regulator-like isoform X2 [Mustelus asterias]
MAAEPESEGEEVPDSGAVFTFGKSKFSDNVPSKFWLKNDKAISISCGDEHTAFITENGKLYIFGSNNWGQLGLGTKNTINKPTCVKALKSEKVKLAACGRNHTLVCTEQGNLYASGDNSEGQLGLGDTEEKTTFQRVEFFTHKQKIKHLAAGSNISAALTDDGQLYTFGESDNGKLGLPLDQPINHRIPQPVAGISGKVTQVSCGGDHTIVLTEKDVYAFGFGQFGQLGHGTFIFESSLPKVVEQLKKKKVQFISCGENHTAVVTDNSLLYTFGDGRHGKLGLGEENFTNQFKPTLCSRFLKLAVQSVACGGCHMLVLARPRPKGSENIVIKDDDINENYLTDTYSATLGDSSTTSTLRRALSARIRRREREMSPEKFGQLVRTLPPIGASLLNSSLPISSQTIPGMKVAEESLIASKPINGVKIFEEAPSPNIVPRVKDIKNAQKSSVEEESEEENDKGFGDTTDLLNMTHTVVVNPNDKTLTLSPVHKEKKEILQDEEVEDQSNAEEDNEEVNENVDEVDYGGTIAKEEEYINKRVTSINKGKIESDEDEQDHRTNEDARSLGENEVTSFEENEVTSFEENEETSLEENEETSLEENENSKSLEENEDVGSLGENEDSKSLGENEDSNSLGENENVESLGENEDSKSLGENEDTKSSGIIKDKKLPGKNENKKDLGENRDTKAFRKNKDKKGFGKNKDTKSSGENEDTQSSEETKTFKKDKKLNGLFNKTKNMTRFKENFIKHPEAKEMDKQIKSEASTKENSTGDETNTPNLNNSSEDIKDTASSNLNKTDSIRSGFKNKYKSITCVLV